MIEVAVWINQKASNYRGGWRRWWKYQFWFFIVLIVAHPLAVAYLAVTTWALVYVTLHRKRTEGSLAARIALMAPLAFMTLVSLILLKALYDYERQSSYFLSYSEPVYEDDSLNWTVPAGLLVLVTFGALWVRRIIRHLRQRVSRIRPEAACSDVVAVRD